jgi:hypothetical protein
MFGALHLNQEKIKFQYTFIINELKNFGEGLKLKKVSEDELFTVKKK